MKLVRAFVVLFSLVILDSARAAEKKFYLILYKRSKVSADMELNGVRFFSRTDGPDASGQVMVNAAVMPGENRIRVLVAKPAKKTGAAKQKLEILLYLTAEGQFPDEGEKLAEIVIPENGNSVKEEITSRFNVSFLPPTELWSQIRIESPAAAEQKELVAQAKSLHAAMAAGSSDEVMRLMEYKIRDSARLNFEEYNPQDQKYREQVAGLLREIKGKLQPFPAKPQIRPIAGGRLFAVQMPDGKEAISARISDGGTYSLQIIFAKINGKWVLVR